MTKATKTATAKTVRGPKQGSARANQSVTFAKGTKAPKGKMPKVQGKGVISVHNATQDGNAIFVQSDTGSSFTRPRYGDSKEFRAISAIGMNYAAALKWHNDNAPKKPVGKLASGISAKDAPHSAKAVADNAKAAPAAKAAKAAAPKAAKNKAPSAGANRAYTKGATAINAKPDTWRHHMLSTIVGAKDTDSAKAAHAKSGKFSDRKLDFNWASAQGYIKFAK